MKVKIMASNPVHRKERIERSINGAIDYTRKLRTKKVKSSSTSSTSSTSTFLTNAFNTLTKRAKPESFMHKRTIHSRLIEVVVQVKGKISNSNGIFI